MTSTAGEGSPSQIKSIDPTRDGPIVARGGQYYRNMRYIMCVGLIGMGAWFGYDGYVGYPKLNEQIRDATARHEQAVRSGDQALAAKLLEERNRLGDEKTPLDIGLQKGLLFVLPPLGVLIVLRALYKSRGEYRLTGQTLEVPGHPPVPFANITSVDKRLWDRKGIAYVHYDLGNGQKGKITLDDFIYDRPPTDAIYDQIDRYINPATSKQPAKEAEQPLP